MLKKYIKKYKLQYFFGIITLFIVDINSLKIPQFLGEITQGLEKGELGIAGIFNYVKLIVLVGLWMAIGRFGWRYFVLGASRKIEYELRDDMFKHLTKLSMRYYNENKTGDLMAHFTNDLQAIRMSIGIAVVTTFDASIMTIMVITKMITYVNLKLTLLACIPMIIILFGGIKYGKAIEKRFDEKQKAFSDLTDEVQESISGIRVIKAFVQEEHEIKAFGRANQNNKEKNLSVVKLQAIIMPFLDMIIGISAVITLFYGGYLVLKGQITSGQFVAFNSYIGMLVWPMLAVGESITFFSQGRASMKRIEAIFREVPDITDDINPVSVASAAGEIDTTGASGETDTAGEIDTADVTRTMDSIKGNIRLNHLSFRFKKDLPMVLEGISVDIEKGSTLAILGRTGSGKTALANLLLRMYNVERGMILIDGHDMNDIPLKTLRESIAYVPQDNFLFSDTLQTNIAFGSRDLIELPEHKKKFKIIQSKKERLKDTLESDFMTYESEVDQAYNDLEEVKNAAKLACIHDNIMDFPENYATMVGERGVTISGGQKQRSSIARALMKEAPILILDDALSAVDTNTEESILRNLKNNRKGKTTIIIAHRISTIQDADKILFLEDGKVAEYGTHIELLALGGQYAKLYWKQQLEQQLEMA